MSNAGGNASMGNLALEGDEDGVGAFGTVGACKGQGVSQHLGQIVIEATPFPGGITLGSAAGCSLHVSFLSGEIAVPNVVRSKPKAWVSLLRKFGTVCGHSGLDDPAYLGTPSCQRLFLQCGLWLWVER